MSPNEVHLADLDAVPTDAILCERCGKTILSREEQQVASGYDFLHMTRHRVRLLVPLRTAWHHYNAHGNPRHLFELLHPLGSGLTAKERVKLRYELRKVSRTKSVYAARRRLARRLGGRPGEDAERALQAKFPVAIPATLTVERTIVNCPAAMAVAKERRARLIERGNALYARKVGQVESSCSMRDLIIGALDRLQEEVTDA